LNGKEFGKGREEEDWGRTVLREGIIVSIIINK
jgi:hypothetical protein